MESTNIPVNDACELAQRWKTLQQNVKRMNNFSYDFFEKLFADTYRLLKNCTKESTIDKSLMPLIVNAYCFANLSDYKFDSRIVAAFVLTERMLQYCVVEDDSNYAVDGVTVYSIEERKEIFINFNDIGSSMKELINAIDSNSYKNVVPTK